MIPPQGQGKRFFVETMLAQPSAKRHRSPMQSSTCSASPSLTPDCVVNPALADQLAEEISDEEYEAKAFGLLERSWTRDVASDDTARHSYRKAYAVLSEGNHYLLVMIDRALGRADRLRGRQIGELDADIHDHRSR